MWRLRLAILLILKIFKSLVIVFMNSFIFTIFVWSLIFEVYRLSVLLALFYISLLPIGWKNQKLLIFRITFLMTLFIFSLFNVNTLVESVDSHIVELSRKYVYSYDNKKFSLRDKLGVFGLNILMGVMGYPIYPEASKETLLLIFSPPDNGFRVFDGKVFLKSMKVRRILENELNKLKRKSFLRDTTIYKTLLWSIDDYKLGRREARYALALNGGVMIIRLKRTDDQIIPEITLRVHVKYAKRKYVYLITHPKLGVEEGLFWRLQKEGWLHPYWADWIINIPNYN